MFGLELLQKKPAAFALANTPNKALMPAGASPNDEYLKVARTIGFQFEQPRARLAELHNFLYKTGWPIYNLDAVLVYMKRIADRDNPNRTGWGWTRLRDADRSSNQFAGAREATKTHDGHLRRSAHDWLNKNAYVSYKRPIPLHALKKVEVLETAGFKPSEGFKFAVSDYDVDVMRLAKPDPFLMVYVDEAPDGEHIPRSHRFVIDFWDEPGFGIEEQLK